MGNISSKRSRKVKSKTNLPSDTCSCRWKTGGCLCHICSLNSNQILQHQKTVQTHFQNIRKQNELEYIMYTTKPICFNKQGISIRRQTAAPIFYHSKSTNNDFIILSVTNTSTDEAGVYKQSISNYSDYDGAVKIVDYPQQFNLSLYRHSIVVNPDNGDIESNKWKKQCSSLLSMDNMSLISQWIPFPYNEMHFFNKSSRSMTANTHWKYCIGSTGKTKKYLHLADCEITNQDDVSKLTPSSCIMIYENGSEKLLLIDIYKTGQIWEYNHEQSVWILLDISLPKHQQSTQKPEVKKRYFLKTIIGFDNVLFYFDGDFIWFLDLLSTKQWYKAPKTFNTQSIYDTPRSPYRYCLKASDDKMYFLNKELQMIEFSLLDIFSDELCSNILPRVCTLLVDGYARQNSDVFNQISTDLLCLCLDFWGPPLSKSEAISFYGICIVRFYLLVRKYSDCVLK